MIDSLVPGREWVVRVPAAPHRTTYSRGRVLRGKNGLRVWAGDEYLREELERLAARPSVHAWLEHVRERKRAAGRRVAARRIRTHRDADRR